MKFSPDVNFESFCDFCKNNIPLLVATAITLLFCYGINFFQHSIGIDTEIFMLDKDDTIKWNIQIGRFGLAFLQLLLYAKGFNPFFDTLSTFCLILLFTVSWAYTIAIFSKNIGKNNALIPFAIVFASSPTWAEQFYFIFQSTAIALMVLICPYAIYILFKGFLNNEKIKVVFAFLLLLLMISVYQAMIPFFCCGIFICFLLLYKTSDLESSAYRNLSLKIFATLIGAIIVYFLIDRTLIPFIFDIEKSQYLDGMNLWGEKSIKELIFRIFGFICIISGLIMPQLQDMMMSIIPNAETIKIMINKSKVFGNILLLPIIALFIIKIVNAKRGFIYILTCVFILLSVIFLAILIGNIPPMRATYVLPLALAFIFFFLIESCSKKTAIVVVIFAMFTIVHQVQTTAQLLYSDQLRYNEDVRLAYEIRNTIIQYEKTPVAIIGKYKVVDKFHAFFLQGEVIGHSFFEWGDTREITLRSLAFMRTLGIQFDDPSDEQLEIAINEAKLMPSYPNYGYVKKNPDVIVVKLSE